MKKKLMPLIACSGTILFLVFGVFDSNTHANNVITLKGIIQSITADEMIVQKTWQSKEVVGSEVNTRSEDTSNKNVSVSISKYTVVQDEKGKTIPSKSLAVGSPVLIEGRYLEEKSIRANLIKIISREELKKDFEEKK